MRCPRCDLVAPADAAFCPGCGARLTLTCAACGIDNAPDHRFCKRCGQALPVGLGGERGAARSPRAYTPAHLAERILGSRGALEGERKQVTVLFCDVVDSTRLAERLDPEQMHEVMDRALRLMAEAVHRYEGTVNQFLGDGLMALFGAPVALEDHALRAVEAALAIQETIAGYSSDLQRERGVALPLRVGLNTGEVVVGRIGDDLRMDYTAVGGTTNLAARLQGAAEPGGILVSEATHRLVDGLVRSEPVGALALKGLDAPVSAWRVTGRRRGRTRLDVSAERGLTPLIGRERELGLLRDCLERVRAGRGQVVGIVGEAGAGKSRLVHEFRQAVEGERLAWLAGHCLARGQDAPYLPMIEVLRGALQVDEDDNPLQIAEKLRKGVRGLDPALEPTVPLLAALLAAGPEDESVKALDARARRRRTFEALRALTMAGVARRPHVLVVEDLHWIDSTSEEYLLFLVESLAAAPLLLITTHRPGHAVRWADRAYYTQIALDVLGDRDTEAMMESLLGTGGLPAELVRLVRERAEGNPLFVEEIVRTLVDRRAVERLAGGVRWAGAAVELPQSALDVIRARIDHLEEPVKRTLQAAAVIGRSFGAGLLARVVEAPEEVPGALRTLEHLGLVHPTRFFPEEEYRFKHALIQDVAYQTLLSRRRHALHGAVGRAIEELHAERLPEQCEVLAHHFALAEDAARAMEYLEQAGDRAHAAFADVEATTLYQRALGFVGAHDDARRARLLHQLALAGMFTTDQDVNLSHAQEALGLHERLGDRRRAMVMHGHVATLYVGSNWDGAREDMALGHLEAAAAIAAEDPDSVEKGLIYQRMGHLYLHRGDPATTVILARRAVEVFSRVGAPFGTSLGTATSYVGRIDEGVAYNEGNWDAVQRSGNPIVMGVLGHELVLTLTLARDMPRARHWGTRALDELLRSLAAVKGAPRHLDGFVRRPLAFAEAMAGAYDAAAEQGRLLEEAEQRSGTYTVCKWEDACFRGLERLRRGELDGARRWLEATLTVMTARNQIAAVSGCRYALGLVAAEQGQPAEAEALLRQALETCRAGGNVLFELWILPALAEVLMRQGQREQARILLERAELLLEPGRTWHGLPAPVLLARGMLARHEGHWAEAERCCNEAVAVNRRYELPWDEARGLEEWALTRLARDPAQGRAPARARFGEALEIFQRLGAVRDAERVRAALSSLA